jgi:hypothetical protein
VPERPTSRTSAGELGAGNTVLCGDATSPTDVERLLAGAAPALLSTDPPYGVSLDPTWRDGVYNARRVKGWGVVAGAEKRT